MSSLFIYIHGFNSSPQSLKAQQMREWCETHRPDIEVVIPKLPPYPKEAAKMLKRLIQEQPAGTKIGLAGSSLGGYLATWLNQQFAIPAVVINPAVQPYLLLSDYLGPVQNPYTGENYLLEAHHMAELRALEVEDIAHPEQIWLLQQEGDELLDYQQAVAKYQQCKQTVEPNGCHAFTGFERFCEPVIQFLAL